MNEGHFKDCPLFRKPAWYGTRHCPECGSTSLCVSSHDPFGHEFCTTECADCGEPLRIDYSYDEPWENPEWAKSVEN